MSQQASVSNRGSISDLSDDDEERAPIPELPGTIAVARPPPLPPIGLMFRTTPTTMLETTTSSIEGEDKEILADLEHQAKIKCLKRGLILLVFTLVVTGIVIGAKKMVGKNQNTQQVERYQAFVFHLGPYVSSNASVFEDTSTVQYQSMLWLANVDTYIPPSGPLFPDKNPLQSMEDPEQKEDSQTAPPPTAYIERYAMTLFYYATNGPNSWVDRANFLTPKSVCEWRYLPSTSKPREGASCNDDGTVTGIKFDDHGLEGELPSEIALLTNLRDIDLERNRVFGSIPTDIGLLTNLFEMFIGGNDLSPLIPTEIGLCTSLRFLDLSANSPKTSDAKSGSIPSEIGLLAYLSYLDFSFNTFTGTIPTELGLNFRLNWLILSDNQLKGSIPTELGALTRLTGLEVGSNELTKQIPTEFGQLKRLTKISLYNNKLTGSIPEELGLLENLSLLDLSRNDKLTGTLPTAFDVLPELNRLLVHGTSLTANLTEFCNNRVNPMADFWSDCLGDEPEVECSCCDICCEPSGGNCTSA